MRTRKIKLSEDLLIRALREKNEVGAKALYDMYAQSLYGVIHRIIPDTCQAEDVLQEVFLKIWNLFDKYEAAKGRLFTWMINIARNMAIDAVRNKTYRRQALHDDMDGPVKDLAQPEPPFTHFDLKAVKLSVAELRSVERSVIELIYFQGFKHTEVAESLNIPLGSVKTYCRSAIFKLRDIYAEPPVPRLTTAC